MAVGINCTAPAFVMPLIQALKASTSKPIVVYPNSGEGWDAQTHSWTGKADPGGFAESARQWRKAGAQIIGGCCRTGPDHVRAVRQVMMEPEPVTVETAKRAQRRSANGGYVLSEVVGTLAAGLSPTLFWAFAIGLVLGFWETRTKRNDEEITRLKLS